MPPGVFIGRDGSGKRKYRNELFVGTLTAAGRRLDALHTARNTGALAAETRQTVGQWVDEWLAGRKLAVGPRTYADYVASLKRYVRPALGTIRLSRLTKDDIQRVVNEMDARGLKPHTIRLALAPLGAALATAVADGKIVKNPSDGVTQRAIPDHAPAEAGRCAPAVRGTGLAGQRPRVPDGDRPATRRAQHRCSQLLTRAELPPMRLYDLRHSMATLLLAGGVNPKIVSEQLGHAKVGMTLDTYSHVLPTMQREAADMLARLVRAQPA